MMMTVPNFFPLDRSNFGIISSGSFFFYFLFFSVQQKLAKKFNYGKQLQIHIAGEKTSDPPQTGAGTEGLLTDPGFIYGFQTHTDKFTNLFYNVLNAQSCL